MTHLKNKLKPHVQTETISNLSSPQNWKRNFVLKTKFYNKDGYFFKWNALQGR